MQPWLMDVMWQCTDKLSRGALTFFISGHKQHWCYVHQYKKRLCITLIAQEYAVTRWTEAGAPRKKIVMGVNFQARTYILAKKKENQVGAAAHGPGNPGPLTNSQGTLAYFEVHI